MAAPKQTVASAPSAMQLVERAGGLAIRTAVQHLDQLLFCCALGIARQLALVSASISDPALPWAAQADVSSAHSHVHGAHLTSDRIETTCAPTTVLHVHPFENTQ